MEQISLYKGSVALEFDSAAHRYFYGGQPVPSVTQITGIIDKSEPLMAWAVREAVKYAQKNPNIHPKALADGMATAYKNSRGASAKIGNEAHAAIEAYISEQLTGDQLFPDALLSAPKAIKAYGAFKRFCTEERPTFLCTERRVFSLEHIFAGTLDTIAILPRISETVPFVLDFKTSNDFHKEYGMQTSAYKIALQEEESNTHDYNRAIVMLDKDSGKHKLIVLTDHDKDAEAFLAARKLLAWRDGSI